MHSDAATAAWPARRPEGLTARASRNAVASLLDYGAKLGVGLAITPVVLRALGPTLFGVWEVLGRLTGFLSVTDGRSMEALRLVVAREQHDPDDEGKRRHVGAALVVWGVLLPLVLAAGLAFVWFAPAMTGAPAWATAAVRVTCALLVGAFIVRSVAAIAESVLQGMNLGYRRMGLQAAITVVGGVVAVGALHLGFGIAGLGTARIAEAVAAGACFWWLTRRFVPWLGVARPRRDDVRSLLGMSLWLTAGDVIAKLLLATDVIILGVVVGPSVVTTYVLTGYAARAAASVHVLAAGATVPGFGGVLGSGDRPRTTRARREMLALTWLFMTVSGATILLWNQSFVALWVGPGQYAGALVNVLVVLAAAQTAFIRVDAYLIDASLRPRDRVQIGALAAVVMVTAALLLARWYGVPGLCVGLLLGRVVQSVGYPRLVRHVLGSGPLTDSDRSALLRMGATSVLLMGGSLVLGTVIPAPETLAWLAGVAVTVPVAATIALTVGPTRSLRAALVARIELLLPERWRS